MKLAKLTGAALALASALAQGVTGCGGSVDGNGQSGGAAGGGSPGGGGASGSGGTPYQGGGGYACFAAGTPIATPRGEVPIDRLRVGDLVLAYDEARHAVVARPVVRTFAHPDQIPGRLVLDDGKVLNVTDNHPIYLPDRSDYVAAEDVHGDTRLLLWNGTSTQSGIAQGFLADPGVERQTVYNIEVAEHHNYFAGDVLVHNKSGGAPPCYFEKKVVDGTDACNQAEPCLDPDPSTFEELQTDGGTDGGGADAALESGPELQRRLCAPTDPALSYAVAFELKSPEPNSDYLSLVSSPSFETGTGGSGPCSGVELGQIWTSHEADAATDTWQTLCTQIAGGDLREQLAILAEAPAAQLRNLRFVQACDCNLSKRVWSSCSGGYGAAEASSCL